MSILVCTPMYGGMCTAGYFRSCLDLRGNLLDAGMEHDWLITTNESLIPRARNTQAATFLETDYQALLFIDADIEFTSEDVAKLWNLGEPIAVGAYSMKRPDFPLSAWEGGKLVEIEGRTDPFPVDFAGTGFMLIRREVFEKLIPHVPKYKEGKPGDFEVRATCWGFFQDPITDWHCSEDYFFCALAREHGYRVMCDPTIRLTHWGSFGYTGVNHGA